MLVGSSIDILLHLLKIFQVQCFIMTQQIGWRETEGLTIFLKHCIHIIQTFALQHSNFIWRQILIYFCSVTGAFFEIIYTFIYM